MNAKYHSNLKRTDLFIVENARPQRRSRDRFGGRSRFNRQREMHTATCGDCGNECQVPFKPKEDRPVYCREC
ncbi:hypothetical protein AAA799B03_00241 [Marine Group I thaumarchaeote SCGC AAA799-B03]|uniref:CxxC-x17-CxxC domain-containing protein n=1 Tax=Marine Group I thaumarchaeote SCGC AAA799-B03 TaxID=1502289 RepID=A0A087S8P2_9ARCH|nr:hypothetical protein AAA799B03_00241 [Marine Group I thaumarchaeote SCGC AAA799-B03]